MLRFLFVFIFIVNTCRAQLIWKEVSSNYDTLPRSVKLFETRDSLNGRPFHAFYLSAYLPDRSIDFNTFTTRFGSFTPSHYYDSLDHPLVIVNGSFFNVETNQVVSLVMQESVIRAYNLPALKAKANDGYYYPTRGALGIRKSRKADVAWIFTDSSRLWPYAFQQRPIVAKGLTADPTIKDLNTIDHWHWWKMRTAVGGGPVLIHDSVIRITNREEQIFLNGETDIHPRTAMGYTAQQQLIILVIEGRTEDTAMGATLEETAKILFSLGCVEALNLDGGGSSCMLVNGKETIKPSDLNGQRPVPSVFFIRRIRR